MRPRYPDDLYMVAPSQCSVRSPVVHVNGLVYLMGLQAQTPISSADPAMSQLGASVVGTLKPKTKFNKLGLKLGEQGS